MRSFLITIYYNMKKFLFILKYHNLLRTKEYCLLVNTPNYDNIGDEAIAFAELTFINAYIKKETIDLTTQEFRYFKKYLVKNVKRDTLIFLQGGGNMGDEYIWFENTTRDCVSSFPNHNIVIMPQTIYYTDTTKGNMEKEKSIAIYNNHKNLTILAREKVSYELMSKLYPNANVHLVPDIVLTLPIYESKEERSGALLCLRNDREKVLDQEDLTKIENLTSQYYPIIKKTDMIHSSRHVKKGEREQVVHDKMKEFSRAELVITDRLHGMILAAITNTPCLVFSNYNHKVEGVYEWIKDLDFIKLTNIESFEQYLYEIKNLTIKNQYHPLTDIILQELEWRDHYE